MMDDDEPGPWGPRPRTRPSLWYCAVWLLAFFVSIAMTATALLMVPKAWFN